MKTRTTYIGAVALFGLLSAILLFCAAAQNAGATEYLVRLDGAVTTLSGEVSVIYNAPGGGGAVKAVVPAGYSFDPSSGTVVPTTAAYLQNIIADINTSGQNARVFHVGDANVVVKPDHPAGP